MAEYIAFDEHVEVNGQTILSTLAGVGEAVRPILDRYGLSSLQPEEWYPQQAWLNVLKDIHDGNFLNLVGIGMAIPENAKFPTEIDSIDSALKLLDTAYHMNHRNGEIGHYHYQPVSEGAIDVICDNPYPSDFDYGIIYGLVKRFRPEGTEFKVVREPSPCRKKGDDICIYHVLWNESW